MKQILSILSALCLIITAASAQSVPGAGTRLSDTRLGRFLKQQPGQAFSGKMGRGNGSIAQKGTAQATRLLAYTRHGTENGTPFLLSDTAVYHYNGGHSGTVIFGQDQQGDDAGFNDHKFDTAYVLGLFDNFYPNYDTARFVKLYDANDRVTTEYVQFFIDTSWVTLEEYFITYQANNRIKSFYWTAAAVGGPLENEYRQEYTYDAQDRRIETTYQAWNNNTNIWENEGKRWVTYSNTTNRQTEAFYKDWKPATSTFENQSRITYHYNSAGDNDEVLFETWSANNYLNAGKYLYTYDANHNCTAEIYQLTATPVTFQNYERTSATYNANGQILALLFEQWNSTTGAWEVNLNSWRQHYYYEAYNTTGIGKVAPGAVKVFPSPSSGLVSIDMQWPSARVFTLSVYDGSGRMIRQSAGGNTAHYQSTIDLSGFPTGMYFIKVTAGGDVYNAPVCIVK